jgi:hypothetical protein
MEQRPVIEKGHQAIVLVNDGSFALAAGYGAETAGRTVGARHG